MEIFKNFQTSVDGYRIELADKSRLAEMVKFFRDHYHPEESMSRGLKAAKAASLAEDQLKLIEEDEDHMIVDVWDGSPCLIAIDNDTEEIAGAILTSLSRRPKIEEDADSFATTFDGCDFKSDFMNEYLNYYSHIDEAARIYEKYPNAEVTMELFAIAVHKGHRRKGLANDLTRGVINLAKSMPGVGVVFAFYTSKYSKRAAERIGLKIILDFDLKTNFIDHNGDPAFGDMGTENIVSVMAVEMNSE